MHTLKVILAVSSCSCLSMIVTFVREEAVGGSMIESSKLTVGSDTDVQSAFPCFGIQGPCTAAMAGRSMGEGVLGRFSGCFGSDCGACLVVLLVA